MTDLPGVLGEIARLIGADSTRKLAAARGGGYVYIPARLNDDHWLVLLLGRADAEALSGEYGGNQIKIGMGPSGVQALLRRQIAEAIRAGERDTAIARRLGIDLTTVKRHRARLKERRQDPQLSLFRD